MTSAQPVNAALLLDRFVSASTAVDVHSSLESILKALEAKKLPVSALLQNDDDDDEDVYGRFLQVLGTQESHNNRLPVGDEGSNAVARILLKLVQQCSSDETLLLLTQPQPGRLLETLLDVACSRDDDDDDDSSLAFSSYTRVLCLQILQQLTRSSSTTTTTTKTVQDQILQAPNGLHRLGKLLQSSDEVVRNQALLVASQLAAWAAVAKVWMFQDMGATVLHLAATSSDVEFGSILQLDCLRLLQNLLRHDASTAELLFASGSSTTAAWVTLLDLRNGAEFKYPSSKAPPLAKKKTTKKKKQTTHDDLDDLLNSSTPQQAPQDSPDKTKDEAPEQLVIPYLTAAEEDVIGAVLDVLEVVLENESVRKQVWQQHTNLVFMIWQMGLLTAPASKPQHAYPSLQLQQRGLQVTARYLNDPNVMDRLAGLDRLLLLVCTAGGRGETLAEKLALSQSALHVIRRTLAPARAQEMLLHTLAPPPDDSENTTTTMSAEAEIIHRLVNTVSGNLVRTESRAEQERRVLLLSGSLGSLALFLTDEPARAVLLRLTSQATPSLLESLLQVLQLTTSSDETNTTDYYYRNHDDSVVQMVVLRFLCHWVTDAPIMVQSVLQSSVGASLLVTLMDFQKRDAGVAALGCLLVGLLMEYIRGGDGDDDENGGWTRTSLWQLVNNKVGVSTFTSKLQDLQSHNNNNKKRFPWSYCPLEWQVWAAWYPQQVLLVRKRVIQELTGGGGDDGSGTIHQLVAQQTTELEELRNKLAEAETKVAVQGAFVWPRR